MVKVAPRVEKTGVFRKSWNFATYWGLIHNLQTYFTHKFWALIFENSSSMLDIDIEVRWFSVMGVWISLGIVITVSSNVNCWTVVDISFVWHVILVSSDGFSELPRALFMMSSYKFLIKWVFCWTSSSIISSTWKGRLFSEVISVVEGREESKCCGVLILVIIFLSNNWDILTAMQPPSKLVPLVLLIFFVF